MHIGWRSPGFAAGLLLAAQLPACSIGNTSAAGDAELTGTTWELVSIQSMDDAVGTTTIDDPSLYTVSLGEHGLAAFRFNCNRGHGSWEAKPGSADSGQLKFGAIAATRAPCTPPSVDERVARDMGYVRSYLLRDGRLHMSLMADGGIYTWRRGGTPTAEFGRRTVKAMIHAGAASRQAHRCAGRRLD